MIESKKNHQSAKDLFSVLLHHKTHLEVAAKVAQINAYLGSLKIIIAEFERRYVTKKVDPIELLKNLMEMHELTQNDPANEIGAQPHVSRILAGNRPLTVEQMKALGKRFKVDPALFLAWY